VCTLQAVVLFNFRNGRIRPASGRSISAIGKTFLPVTGAFPQVGKTFLPVAGAFPQSGKPSSQAEEHFRSQENRPAGCRMFSPSELE